MAQVFSCEFCEIFKNNFFIVHLVTTGSIVSLAVSLMEFFLIEVALEKVDEMSFHSCYRGESKFFHVNKTRTIHVTMVEVPHYMLSENTKYTLHMLHRNCYFQPCLEIFLLMHCRPVEMKKIMGGWEFNKKCWPNWLAGQEDCSIEIV